MIARRRSALPVGLLVAVAIFAAGCGSVAVPDTAEPTATPTNSLTPTPTGTPIPTIALPTPQPASQEAVFGAAARWILREHAADLSPITYVLETTQTTTIFEPRHVPELVGGGPPLWGETLTAASRTALETALDSVVRLDFVATRDEPVDPDADEFMMCRPFFGRGVMLVLGKPIAVGERFLLEVDINSGCEGRMYLVAVERSGLGFEVTQVIQTGSWIV